MGCVVLRRNWMIDSKMFQIPGLLPIYGLLFKGLLYLLVLRLNRGNMVLDFWGHGVLELAIIVIDLQHLGPLIRG